MNFKTIRLIAAGLLFIGILELPYGYYILLRIVICILSVITAFISSESNSKSWMWLFGIIAILFNPIIPIYLEKEIWIVIDFIVAIIFIISIFTVKISTEGDGK